MTKNKDKIVLKINFIAKSMTCRPYCDVVKNMTMLTGSESPADCIKVYNGGSTCEQAVKFNVPVSLHADGGYNTLTHLPRHQTFQQKLWCMFYMYAPSKLHKQRFPKRQLFFENWDDTVFFANLSCCYYSPYNICSNSNIWTANLYIHSETR